MFAVIKMELSGKTVHGPVLKATPLCGSMADIQSAAAEIRRGKKKRRRKKEEQRQDENIMICPIP